MGFSKMPKMKKEQMSHLDERKLLKQVEGIDFSIGGFSGGYSVVKIRRSGNFSAICACRYPLTADEDHFYIREFSREEWKDLINKLINQYSVHKWDRKYFNNSIMDGTQWELILRIPEEPDICISGSNEYPPMFDSVEREFEYYMKQKVLPEMDPVKRAPMEYLFRNDPRILKTNEMLIENARWHSLIEQLQKQ